MAAIPAVRRVGVIPATRRAIRRVARMVAAVVVAEAIPEGGRHMAWSSTMKNVRFWTNFAIFAALLSKIGAFRLLKN